MIKSLEAGELDVAVGLTEGWVAELGKGSDFYKMVGTYVSTSLCWAISSGANRSEITSTASLQNGKLGISRYGSGSYVMGFVLADQNGWLEPGKEPFEFVPLNDFKNLRDGVNDKRADAFMWEVFTSKRYYDSGEIKKVGEIYTPWPSWQIVAHTSWTQDAGKKEAVKNFLEAVNEGVEYFNGHKEEAVEWIAGNLDYSAEDAREWMKTVKFSADVAKVEDGVAEKTVGILRKAGVVKDEKVKAEDMVVEMK